ncbi:MAG: tagaturonate reductase [Bernardetiaceae bacterium]|jgi:tagaturonate reductase|nr:tagaturonate reductase [Bernardetiaceae bacterium]
MELLNRAHLPQPSLLQLPETVIQFGTGVLLRGLIDYYIDKGNRNGHYAGRVLVVKSTPGRADDFAAQAGLYSHRLKGYQNGQYIEETVVNSAISRVLAAADHWPEVLAAAARPEVRLVISNTTEVGIQYVEEHIFAQPPASFPAKLAALLYARYRAQPTLPPGELTGLVVVPTELLPNNGDLLKSIVVKLAQFNQLEPGFLAWLDMQNVFCNSLVDRIVPGTPPDLAQQWDSLGYRDPLLINSETYGLWAVQGGPAVKKVMGFAEADPGLIIADDIEYYRERKLRLLNGTHTISVCLGFLNGLNTVYECMQHLEMAEFFTQVMQHEVAPTLPLGSPDENQDFADQVLARFRNPAIVHPLINITLQATSKMKMRNLPTIKRYLAKFGQVPPLMAQGFAAYLRFMKVTHQDEAGRYWGQRGQEAYPIQDDWAGYYYQIWAAHPTPEALVAAVLGHEALWGENLNAWPGWPQAVTQALRKWE